MQHKFEEYNIKKNIIFSLSDTYIYKLFILVLEFLIIHY